MSECRTYYVIRNGPRTGPSVYVDGNGLIGSALKEKAKKYDSYAAAARDYVRMGLHSYRIIAVRVKVVRKKPSMPSLHDFRDSLSDNGWLPSLIDHAKSACEAAGVKFGP
jgi:hypothetical protein